MSEAITLMTLEEEGAYIRLLARCWDSDDCTLPDDDQKLAVLSRMGERWHSYGPAMNPVKNCFKAHPSKPGRLMNERLMNEWKKLKAFQKEKSESGRKGAESRWKGGIAQPSVRHKHPHGSAIDSPMAKNGSSSSSSSSSSERNPLISPLSEEAGDKSDGDRSGGPMTALSSTLQALFKNKLILDPNATLDQLKEEATDGTDR